MNLSTVYMGLKLRNPLVVGSSGLTGSVDKAKQCADAGAGALVLKSIFEEQIESDLGQISENSWYPEAVNYINAYGSDNAVSEYLKLLEETRRAVDIPVIPSIHCFGKGDWTGYAKKLESSGASGIELNAFILSSDPRRRGRDNENTILDIVTDIKSQVSIPVGVKIGPHFSSISAFAQELDGGTGVDALVLFNRFFRIDFDIENLKVKDGTHFSTPDETEEVLRWVSIISPITACDICSTTGVHDGEAVIKHILAGSQAVQICSALYKSGFGIMSVMLGFMADWMRRHNYNTIEDFRERLSQRNSGNPAEFERVQFMKTSVKA